MPDKEKIVAPPEQAWVVLLMLFVLMGPLAFPMLWESPHFGRATKIVLTVLVCILTMVALVVLWLVTVWFVEQICSVLFDQSG